MQIEGKKSGFLSKKPKNPHKWRRRRDSNPREFDLRQDFKSSSL